MLRSPLPLPMPVRMLQGTGDTDVTVEVALRLLHHAEGPDIRLTLVRGPITGSRRRIACG